MPKNLKHAVRPKVNDKAGEEIRRLWGDVEVKDAHDDLRVFINETDLATAVQKDPAECVFAQACKRVFGSTKVLFFRSVAYVELRAEDGTPRVERFIMPDNMRELVEAFDKGEGVIPQAGFVLRAPPKGRTLEHCRKKSQKSIQNLRRRKLEGEMIGTGIGRGKGKYRDEPLAIDLSVRCGSGSVQFTQATTKIPKAPST